MIVMIVLVSILPILIVNKLFAEESRLRFSQLFSTKVTRSELYWTCIGLAILASSVGIFIWPQVVLVEQPLLQWGHQPTMDLMIFLLLVSITYHRYFLLLVWPLYPWLDTEFRESDLCLFRYSFSVNYFGAMLDIPEWVVEYSDSKLDSAVAC